MTTNPPTDNQTALPPSNYFSANNIILAGANNKIENSSRCSVLNGANNYIDGKYNTHIIGDYIGYISEDANEPAFEVQNNSFHVGCSNGLHVYGDITAFAGSANPISVSSLTPLVRTAALEARATLLENQVATLQTEMAAVEVTAAQPSGIIGYVYCYLPPSASSQGTEVIEIDFDNQTQTGRNGWNSTSAIFHLIDVPNGEIIDMHRPTDSQGSSVAWTSTTDFSDIIILGSLGAGGLYQNWILSGKFTRLTTTYQGVGYAGQTYWRALHTADNKLQFSRNGSGSTNAIYFWFAIVK